ncbi:hypothetical protein DN752_04855 [Echinicola strongylocentroti]|uniref:DUF4955 domain-containing protein n=1 Tax=Echinicola strongylocentroti TaxID=1795355 RepID=A0A2Z4IEK3_9BACT|nr:DUF4955 domain-containing protein [Echinicola strongylocentroti]AWW29512.1 hypothetical protein DN752_04855 [Echinicola strongylocentroti]
MKAKIFISLMLLVLCSRVHLRAQETSIAKMVEKLPDFSYAGYGFGQKNLPTKIDLPIYHVGDYGAIPDDGKSDFKEIQKAIDAAEITGGIVKFQKGRYLVNEQQGNEEGLVVEAGNIILRGAGNGSNGTLLFMRWELEPRDPKKIYSTPAMIQFKGSSEQVSLGGLEEDVREGDFDIVLKNTSALKSGDFILLSAVGTFLNEGLMEGKESRPIWSRLNERGAAVDEMHQVKDVKGNVVSLHAPVTMAMDSASPWEVFEINLIENCAVENIHFVGNFKEGFVHHKNALHDSGFTGISMQRTFNSWIKHTSFSNVSAAASFSSSLCGTFLANKVEGNGGHSSFGFHNSTRGLMAYCEDAANAWHGPNASHRSVGSVVFRFKGINRGIDLHGDFPRNTLFDQCQMAGFDGDDVGKASHGANYKNLPNHLGGLVIWNFTQTDRPRPNFDFWELYEDDPEKLYGPLTAVNPVIVGYVGQGTSFVQSSVGRMVSWGKHVEPESLFIYQKQLRGLEIPEYLKIDD